MVDIRLITLIPPAPAVTQPPSAQAVTPQGTSPTLAQLPVGSLLSGFILNRDANGNPILRTERGDITFASNFFLKIGSEVVIRIQQQAGQQNAHIVSVNGMPPEAATEQSAFQDNGDVIVGRAPQSPPAPSTANTAGTQQSPAPSQPHSLQPGQTISAIVVTPPRANADAPALPPGSSLLLSVLPQPSPQTPAPAAQTPLSQITSGQPATATTSQATPAGNPLASLLPNSSPVITPAPQGNTASSPAIASNQPLPSTPQTTTQLGHYNIFQTAPHAASNQEAASAKLTGPLGQSLTATALVAGDDGSTLLDTPMGTLRVANLALPQGQQLALRVSSVANPNAYTISLANVAPALPPAPLTELSRNWGSLQQIAQVLGEKTMAQIIPTFTMSTAMDITPHSAMRAGSQILFFLSALSGGNIRDWLGSANVKALEEKGYGSLLKKADGEFFSLARQFAEPQPNNWQSMYFPVMAQGEVQQVRAFIKREKKKNEQGQANGDEDARFVVEMELSQLGEIQMDGLVKRRQPNLQFDLVIRSLQPLPDFLERDILEIYNSTAELTGYRGQLLFQKVPSFPVHPLEDTTPHVFDDVVV